MSNTREAEEIKAQMYKESLDTIAVANITEEDFVIYNDKARATRTKWLIPNKNKDLGKGKGVQHIPRGMAYRYVEKMMTKIISEISAKDWDKKKDKYRDEERSKYEEKLAIRTDNPKLREELAKKLWIGVVERYGGDEIGEELEEIKKANPRQDMKDYLENLGLNERLIENASDSAKDQLAREIV